MPNFALPGDGFPTRLPGSVYQLSLKFVFRGFVAEIGVKLAETVVSGFRQKLMRLIGQGIPVVAEIDGGVILEIRVAPGGRNLFDLSLIHI